MRLNLGCGYKKSPSYVNVDKFPECQPDMLVDLEKFPWPFDDNSADEVMFNHSLEHMGADVQVFLGIIKEVYRICKPGARVVVNVPHPRHDDFINDPTHVRAVTPQMLRLFSKKLNQYWISVGDARTSFALYLNVDFELVTCGFTPDPKYEALQREGKISSNDIVQLMMERNNVVKSFEMELIAIK